jgi:hypothetical protein
MLGQRRQEPEWIPGACLNGMQIIATNLKCQQNLTGLRDLSLLKTQVNDTTVQQYKQSLPNVTITK